MTISTFGTRLKEKRLERRLTQAAIANKVGVKRSAVSQWESDETQPKGKNLTKLCKILDCDIDWIQTGKAKEKESILDGLSAQAVMVIRRIAELDKANDDRVEATKILLGEPDLSL